MPKGVPSDKETSRVASSILKRNLRVKAGERVTIEAWPHTLAWAVALSREARRLGALPVIHYEDEASYWDSVDTGETKLLGTPAPHEWAALSKTDVYIHMWGPGDRVRMSALPPKKLGEVLQFNGDWYATARKAGLRGARLEIGRPYPTLARAYAVDQGTWQEQIVAATLVDPDLLQKRAGPIAKALGAGRRLRVTHPNGTDLTLGLAHREARTYTGRPYPKDPKRPFDFLTTLPSGSVRVALDETVADGTLVGNRTCYFEDGVAKGPVFEFSKGRLVRSEFSKGGERFDTPFRTGGAGRDRPGVFSFGLNPELNDTPQSEDLEDGAVMISVGGNENLGGKNRSPFFGWAVIAGSTVEVDGRALPGL